MKTFVPLKSEKPLRVGDVVARKYLPQGTVFRHAILCSNIFVATNNTNENGYLECLLEGKGSHYTVPDHECIIISLPDKSCPVGTPIARHEAIEIANLTREKAEHERATDVIIRNYEQQQQDHGPSLEQRIADCPRNIDAEIILRSHRSRRQYDMDALNDPRTGDWYV